MKNTFLYILTLLAGTILFSSCEDDDTQRIPDLDIGPNVRLVFDPNFSFIDFENLGSAQIKYDFFSESKNIQLIEIRGFLAAASGINSDTVVMKSYTQADIDASSGIIRNEIITAQEFVDAVGLPGGLSDLNGGDSFNLLNRTTLTNGVVYPSPTVTGNTNVTPNITAATATTLFTTSYVTFVGCPSNASDFLGTYSSIITTSNYGGFIGATNDVMITFKGPEPFRYQLSDVSALAYVPFGGRAYTGDLYDICGMPSMLPTQTFGLTTDTGGGTWDPVNGILTLNVFEANNGLSWTIVYTRK